MDDGRPTTGTAHVSLPVPGALVLLRRLYLRPPRGRAEESVSWISPLGDGAVISLPALTAAVFTVGVFDVMCGRLLPRLHLDLPRRRAEESYWRNSPPGDVAVML